MFIRLTTLITLLVLGFSFNTYSADYVGVNKCKKCHKAEKKGEQYKHWSESAHAKAWETLANEKSVAKAKELGLKNHPQKEPDCVKCHITSEAFKEDGVGCESCHGPGSEYKSKKVMKDRKLSAAAGLVKPKEADCRKCHNDKSPFYKEFDFEAAKKKIAHPQPQELTDALKATE